MQTGLCEVCESVQPTVAVRPLFDGRPLCSHMHRGYSAGNNLQVTLMLMAACSMLLLTAIHFPVTEPHTSAHPFMQAWKSSSHGGAPTATQPQVPWL